MGQCGTKSSDAELNTSKYKLCAVLLSLYVTTGQAGSVILLLVMISAEDASKVVEFLRSDPRLHTFKVMNGTRLTTI